MVSFFTFLKSNDLPCLNPDATEDEEKVWRIRIKQMIKTKLRTLIREHKLELIVNDSHPFSNMEFVSVTMNNNNMRRHENRKKLGTASASLTYDLLLDGQVHVKISSGPSHDMYDYSAYEVAVYEPHELSEKDITEHVVTFLSHVSHFGHL